LRTESKKKKSLLENSLTFDKPKVEKLFADALGKPVKIESSIPSGGGCINDCFILKTSSGKFFLKRNEAKKFPKMFVAEARGLKLLNETVSGITPNVIAHSENDDEQFLILECIEKGSTQTEFWNDFAKKLAALHRRSGNFFGLDHDNYIGSLSQSNRNHKDWISFFILERIEPQLKMAIDARELPSPIHKNFEKLFSRLHEIFPHEKSSLVHGDLWSGNYLTGKDGWMKLIDPAVYFGFREMDLAMSKLFGGFDSSLYKCYHEEFPLENGFEKRVDICNLYPLLVHVNLFGGYYAFQVQSIIKKF